MPGGLSGDPQTECHQQKRWEEIVKFSVRKFVGGVFTLLLLGGCATTKTSRPMAEDVVVRGISVVQEIPEHMPSQLAQIAGSQYFLVYAESSAVAFLDSLNPIPISIAGTIAGVRQHAEADSLQARYASVNPYLIARDRMNGSFLVSGRNDALHMMPLVYLVEASDDYFRPTLVFRIEKGEWLGRYMYHLPTRYSKDQLRRAQPDVLSTLRQELMQGANILRDLMERDARGGLVGDQRRATYGSYYLVGSRIAGMVSASIVAFPDAEILEETPDHVVLRSGGKPESGAREGALAFGVHYFH